MHTSFPHTRPARGPRFGESWWGAAVSRVATALAVLAGSAGLASGTTPGFAAMPTANTVGIGGSPCAYATVGEAIAAAAGGDTIYIAPGTYNEVLGVVDMDLHLIAATTDCTQADAAAVPSNHVIDGGGAGAFDGGIVKIAANRTVTVTRLTLRDAQATLGGLVYVAEGANATFESMWLQDGTANNLGGNLYVASNASVQLMGNAVIEGGNAGIAGGGLYAEGAVTLMFGSQIRDSHAPQGGGAALGGAGRLHLYSSYLGSGSYPNSAGAGGGVYLGGQSQLEMYQSSMVRWNSATTTDGGGIYATGSAVVEMYDSSSVYGNEAVAYGGGIYLGNGATLSMTEYSRVGSSNPANGNSAVRGGGIYASDAYTITLLQSAGIQNNSAGDGGGGIYLASGTPLSMTGGYINGNSTTGWGGGMAIEEGEAFLWGTVISGNTAMDGGGAALDSDIDNTLLAINSQIISNTAGVNGGAIHVAQGTFALVAMDGNARLAGNHADQNGGGVYGSGHETLGLAAFEDDDQVVVEANTANGNGGGLYAAGSGFVSLFGSVWITGNVALGDGGGWYQDGGDVLTIVLTPNAMSRIAGNSALNGRGGGIYLNDVASGPGDTGAPLGNLALVGNQADTDGGGLYLSGGTYARLFNARVQDNEAGQDGGGVMVSAARLEVSQDSAACQNTLLPPDHYCSEFRNNGATGNGGAIQLEAGAELVLTSTAIISNAAGLGSGVMSVSNGDELDITNSLIRDNTGKAIYLAADADLELIQSTLAGNDWAIDINDNGAVVDLHSNIIWDNGFGVESAVAPTVGCSISQNGVGGAASDPLFQTTGRGDYRLAAGSPAADACLVGVATDLDGAPRPQGANFDMGAFESGIPLVLFSPGLEVAEGDAGLTPAAFVVSLSETSAQTVTLQVKGVDVNASAGVDYAEVSQGLVFAPGVISQSVPLEIMGDGMYEADEVFELSFGDVSGAFLEAITGTVRIVNDDAWPTVTFDSVEVSEGDTGTTPVTLTVSLSNPSAFTVTVGFWTSDDTATAGDDYQASSGDLVFAPGQETATLVLRVWGDELAEPDEQFIVSFDLPAGPSLLGGGPGDWQAVVTIVDDDSEWTIYLPLIVR